MLYLVNFYLTIIFKIININSKYKIKKYLIIKNIRNFYNYYDSFIFYNIYHLSFNTILFSTYFLYDLLSCQIVTSIDWILYIFLFLYLDFFFIYLGLLNFNNQHLNLINSLKPCHNLKAQLSILTKTFNNLYSPTY